MKSSPIIHGCLLLLATWLQLTSSAQRLLTVNYTTDNQNRYIFTCTNNDYCPYVVQVDFPTLTNAQADHPLPYTTEVKPGTVRLITVSPIDKTKDTKLNFKTSNRKGVMNPQVNLHFVYLLPITPGIETQAYRVANTKGSAGPGAQDTGYAIRLRAKPGDTIYAARRGVVTAVDVSNTENDAGANATNGWNYIEIYHADNSFGQYGVIQKDGRSFIAARPWKRVHPSASSAGIAMAAARRSVFPCPIILVCPIPISP